MAATLKCDTITNASNTGTANLTLDDAGNATVGNTLVMGSSFKRNRIINGDMRIDQRNAGASVTPGPGVFTYTLDRWSAYVSQSSKLTVQQNAGSVTPPAGFTNYLGITSSSAYTLGTNDLFMAVQPIEGLNISDLGWGTANAKTVTLSFWVRSSLTGIFGGSLQNNATTRAYPFVYTISSANTWEQKSITIAGETTGTWLTTNGIGVYVSFGLGMGTTYSGTAGSWATTQYWSATGATSVVGTNGATWYVTGVQLEVGSVATPYERQIYSDQLAQCQRYLPAWRASGAGFVVLASGYNYSTTQGAYVFSFPVLTRVAPTGIVISGNTDFTIQYTASTTTTGIAFDTATTLTGGVIPSVASGLTAGQGARLTTNTASAYIYFTGCEL